MQAQSVFVVTVSVISAKICEANIKRCGILMNKAYITVLTNEPASHTWLRSKRAQARIVVWLQADLLRIRGPPGSMAPRAY